jgi:hypothetical protein
MVVPCVEYPNKNDPSNSDARAGPLRSAGELLRKLGFAECEAFCPAALLYVFMVTPEMH